MFCFEYVSVFDILVLIILGWLKWFNKKVSQINKLAQSPEGELIISGFSFMNNLERPKNASDTLKKSIVNQATNNYYQHLSC